MRVELSGVSLNVVEHGAGRPALLLHGFPLEARMWDRVGGILARRGLRGIAPDLRGFGASVGPPVADLADHVADLVGLLDALGLRAPLPWVGFSMGGYVALEAWRRHPERIGALVLVDTRAAPDGAHQRAEREATAARVEREGSAVVADAMGASLFAPGAPADLRALWRARMASAAPPAVAAALRAMARRADSVPDLPGVRVPTLVLVGDQDAITPPAEARTLADAIPGAAFAVIPGAGHMAPVERPEAVAAHVAAFLGALPAPEGDGRGDAGPAAPRASRP